MVKSMNRRRGQGMTEYIIMVGLIAILLIFAITRYKNQVQITIEGTGDAVGLATDSIPENTEIEGRDARGNKVTYKSTGDRHNGSQVWNGSDGKKYINTGTGWSEI